LEPEPGFQFHLFVELKLRFLRKNYLEKRPGQGLTKTRPKMDLIFKIIIEFRNGIFKIPGSIYVWNQNHLECFFLKNRKEVLHKSKELLDIGLIMISRIEYLILESQFFTCFPYEH